MIQIVISQIKTNFDYKACVECSQRRFDRSTRSILERNGDITRGNPFSSNCEGVSSVENHRARRRGTKGQGGALNQDQEGRRGGCKFFLSLLYFKIVFSTLFLTINSFWLIYWLILFYAHFLTLIAYFYGLLHLIICFLDRLFFFCLIIVIINFSRFDSLYMT